MSTSRTDEEVGDFGDVTLDRATDALRLTAVPDGPSSLTRERTLAALAAGSAGGAFAAPAPWAFLWSPFTLTRVAAVLLLSVGAVAASLAIAGRHRQLVTPVRPTPAVGDGIVEPDQARGMPGASGTAGTPGSAGSTMLTGEIRLDGDAPAPRLINFQTDPGCARRHPGPMYDDSLLVNLDNTLQNVVVSVVAGLPEGKTYPVPPEPVYLDQNDCFYKPHVLAMMTGQRVVVRNSDRELHNTHSLAMNNPSFNIVQPQEDPGTAVPSPNAPEFFQVRCDLHPWMHSWFCVFNHPYFSVSGREGIFTLRDLPPGHYRLRAWHEKLGVQERDVVIKPGQTERVVNFVFHAPPADGAKSPGRAANDAGEGPATQRTSLALTD